MTRIVIIGATSAIATSCGRIWAGDGATLFLAARNADKLDRTAADLRIRGAAAVFTATLDMNDIEAHESTVEQAFQTLGGVDVALIAHGTLPDQRACENDSLLTVREFATNATSTIAMLTSLANRMELQKHGRIAVITSVAGDRGRASNYVYGSAKAAVTTFCEGLRCRMSRHEVTVTDVRPGFVATPLTQRLQLPAALTSSPDTVARQIVDGVARGADVLYTPRYWRLIMWVVRNIPRPIFNRLNFF